MKSKDDSNDPITKQYLRAQFAIFREEIKLMMQDNNKVLISEFQTFIDPVLKIVKRKNEEDDIRAKQTADINDQLEDHEKRIAKLEQS